MKTVISAAGNLKRENPTMNEVCNLYSACVYSVRKYVHAYKHNICTSTYILTHACACTQMHPHAHTYAQPFGLLLFRSS